MMVTEHLLTPALCRYLRSLGILHLRRGRVTVSDVAEHCDRATATTHTALLKLESMGLVSHVEGIPGTWRPVVRA